MTVTTHIAEILRQGIWASLTGGWYYEPSHSTFCNTAHLYLWLVLLIIPLVFGFAAVSSPLSGGLLIGYTSFIVVLFIVLKVIVSYLHVIFDTTEPIVTTRAPYENDENVSEETHNRDTEVSTDQRDGIEMVDLRDMRRLAELAQPTRHRVASLGALERRRVRIDVDEEDGNLAAVDVHPRIRRLVLNDEEEQTCRVEEIEKCLEEEKEEEEDDDDVDDEMRTLEKLELARRSGRAALMKKSEEANTIMTSGETKPAIHRKMSEPLITSAATTQRWTSERRRSSIAEEIQVRRANSTIYTGDDRDGEAGVLSQESLDQARQNAHKSYPSKISSVEEFRSGRLSRRGGGVADESVNGEGSRETEASSSAFGSTQVEADDDDLQASASGAGGSEGNWKQVIDEIGVEKEERNPLTQSDSQLMHMQHSAFRPGPGVPADGPIRPRKKKKKQPQQQTQQSSQDMQLVQVGTSSGWNPVVVSLGELDRPTSTSLQIIGEEQGVDPSMDIKGEITKFLEELIDKHPETLDAIESVRQRRVAQQRVPPALALRTHSFRRPPASTVATLSDLATRDGTHVASGHEDTTQGAVHSFQDEDGNWWTYAFDEHGVGTAQKLGSSHALKELFQGVQDQPGPSGLQQQLQIQQQKPKLEILQESAYMSSDDDDEGQEVGRVVDITENNNKYAMPESSTRRERALSSSSNESFTYIPQLPTSVFHAPSGSGATRGSSRHSQMVAFVNVASRLRAAVRSIPMDDRQTYRSVDPAIMNLIDRGRVIEQRGDSLPPLQDRLLIRLDSGSSGDRVSSRFRFLTDFPAVPITSGPNVTLGPGGTSVEFSSSTIRRPSSVKKSYYYKMRMFPTTDKSFKLKLDRLSVSALFDRNRSFFSCFCDVILAAIVAILAGLVLQTGIFFDLSLFMFAFCVAGAHFSLLKSVQPDAASPIHGFNWLVAYSRPVYFSLLCVALLVCHHMADDPNNEKIPWNWNAYRLLDTSGNMLMLALRDLVATLLILLPFAFTLGWLPQVNTLTHHVLEQIEMHLFGGTAALSVVSAVVQLGKSLAAWAVLSVICHLAFSVDGTSTQNPAFSAFLAACVAVAYVMSRVSSNQQLTVLLFRSIWESICHSRTSNSLRGHRLLCSARASPPDEHNKEEDESVETNVDPLPGRLRDTVSLRARHDVLFSAFLFLGVFALHSTSMFTATYPYFTLIVVPITIAFGVFNHYFYQQLRTHTPWKLIAKPILRSQEFLQFESSIEARLMPFEITHVWLLAFEKNILYPLVAVSLLSEAGVSLPFRYLLCPLIGLRLLRGGFSHPQLVYLPLALAFLATRFDFSAHAPYGMSSTALLPVMTYILLVIYPKWLELYLKINFVMAYNAPWQISWGSAFHAFAQPFSVPHSALIWIQTVISSIISAPLNPFLGSSFFTTSYVRPVKYWERDYNTKRSDASNTRLASQIDRGPMLDDSNLNAVFYEHLTRSLQKSLAGDLMMGRWSTSVQPGDCFILASFYLNCLVHVIEVGNGFVTFQLRGLEFRGTYCHQREVEAISEDQTEGAGFCCCSPGSLPGFLSLNTAWGLRWLAWEVVTGKYIIEGYSITDNSAVNLLQVHELRRLLVTLYVKCIIYYMFMSNKLETWLENETVRSTLEPIVENPRYVDVDPMFCQANDEDYDINENGISRPSFSECYSPWIAHCARARAERRPDEILNMDNVSALCYILSLLGRRALGAAAYNRHSNAAESFLYGLHALFKGDFRITSQRDEWVFADMDLLRCVISSAVKMALKLHQDHFAAADDFDHHASLFNLIQDHQTKLFISHEHDPAWRRAIIANTPSLLALRHMYDDGQDDYKIIMLNKMHLNMRVIKLNRECVRAFWAGQQQELIFLRNRNPERGSIQNARQVLRNMINSSADQPVGYPIYVSPLTTSFAETHNQMSSIVGPPITLDGICNVISAAWRGLRSHFGPSGSSSLGAQGCGGGSGGGASQGGIFAPIPPPAQMPPLVQIPMQQMVTGRMPPMPAISSSVGIGMSLMEHEERISNSSCAQPENSIVHMSADGVARVSLAKRTGSDATPTTSKKHNSGDTPPVSILKKTEKNYDVERDSIEKEDVVDEQEEEAVYVQICDVEQIFKYLNEPLKSTGEPLVVWPSEEIRLISGRSHWHIPPQEGMAGRIMFTWYPNHPNRRLRSHIGEAIHLIAIPAMCSSLVAVGEKGCKPSTHEFTYDINQTGIGTMAEHTKLIKRLTAELPYLNQ